MATVLSTLYPPLVDTFMPAFVNTEPAHITFSISPYNEKKQIKYLHVSLVNQQTNINALASNMVAAGYNPDDLDNYDFTLINSVLILPINHKWITYNEKTELYTIQIQPKLLRETNTNNSEKSYSTDIFYKAQIRFDQARENKPNPLSTSDYLISERTYFSEWSSVCLLKAILKPTLEINQFEDKNDPPIFNPGIIPIIGALTFPEENLRGKIPETMRSYEIEIFNENNPEKILDSTKVIFTADEADPNRIYWLADGENATPGESYIARIKYITKNQYSAVENFAFQVAEYATLEIFTPKFTFKKVALLPYEIDSITDISELSKEDQNNIKIFTEEDGIVEFNVSISNPMPSGYLYIKRSRMENGQFKHWELLSCTKEANEISRDFTDATVCSLERYAYSVQYQLESGLLTESVRSTEIVYPNFYDMLFMRDGVQLAIRYDAKISSLTPIVNRQKIDTLGGKYPKFAENAQMNYKQFNISGYIDAESDFNRKFLNDTSEKYAAAMANYNSQMNGKYSVRNDTVSDGTIAYKNSSDDFLRSFASTTLHDLYPKDNWWWQREFRERAIEWLNDGEPKLFRSMPEGNMTVMLTGISLTPNETLGRRLYNFNATMYEIEDGHSLETLSSLGIINIPDERESESSDSGGGDDEQQLKSVSLIGQMYGLEVGQRENWHVVEQTGNASTEGERPSDYSQLSIVDKVQFIDYDPHSKDGLEYQAILNSIELQDVKIEFETPPLWYCFAAGDQIKLATDDWARDKDNSDEYVINNGNYVHTNNAMALGYKIKLVILNPISSEDEVTLTKDIFIDAKGYYQVPSHFIVKDIILYDGAKATVNYKLKYDLEFNTSTIPSAIDLIKEIVGQISGWWTAETNLSQLITRKYKVETYKENGTLASYTRFSNWIHLGFDATPYAVFGVQYKNEPTFESYVVGRTGRFNLIGDYDFEGLRFIGRRMSLAAEHEPIDLDDWEFVLDDSARADDDSRNSNLTWNEFISQRVLQSDTLVDINDMTTTSIDEGINRLWNNDINEQTSALGGYTSISSIKNPKYNTVYGVQNSNGEIEYVIYYIDHNWYPVTFDSETTILAQVPISGMVNYRGKIITTTY